MTADSGTMCGVDILDAIDEVTAPVCGGCAGPLDPDGPSLYYCDDRCSMSWHETQGEPLVGYVDPWHRPWDFPGVGSDVHVSGDSGQRTFVLDETLTEPPSRGRPSVGSFDGADVVYIDDGSGWREIGTVCSVDVQAANGFFVRFAELASSAGEPGVIRAELAEFQVVIGGAIREAAEAVRPLYEQMRRAGILDEPEPSDPRERALVARRTRSTGPASRGRPPRTIGRASTTARR